MKGKIASQKIKESMSYFIKQIYKKKSASLRKTVFLDRDGVLIKKIDYLSNPSQIQLMPGVVEGVKRLNSENAVLIVVTNQPVIARGLATIKNVKLINNTLVAMLNKKHAYINAIYFCPHHPERNHPDIPPKAMKYRIDCECRKPKLAMLKKAVKDFNINLKKAFIIGDNIRDIEAGENLGIGTILMQTNSVASAFAHAVDIICKQ